MDRQIFIENTRLDGYSSKSGSHNVFCVVPNSGGSLDFGVIKAEIAVTSGMLAVPIRLKNGKQLPNNGGFGVIHMLDHADDFARLDFFSVQDYVDHVVEGFDAVYSGRSGRYIIVRRCEPTLSVNRLLVLQASQLGDYYSVVSGWLLSAEKEPKGTLLAESVKRNEVVVWERRAPRSKQPGLAIADETNG